MKTISTDSPIFQTACPLCHEGKVIITVGKLCTCTACDAFVECVRCGNSRGLSYVQDGPNSYFYCHECEHEFGWDWRDGSSVYATRPEIYKNDKCPKCNNYWDFKNDKKKPFWYCRTCKTHKIPDELLTEVIALSLDDKFGKEYFFISSQDPLKKYDEYIEHMTKMAKKKRRPKPDKKSEGHKMNKIVPIDQWLAFQEYQKKGNKQVWEEFRRFRDMKDSLAACGHEIIEAFTIIKNSVDNSSGDLESEIEVLEKSVMDLDAVLSEVFLTRGHRWDNDADLWKQDEDKDRWPDGDDTWVVDGEESYRIVPQNHNKKIAAGYSEVEIEDVPGDIFAVAVADKPKPKNKTVGSGTCTLGDGTFLLPPDETGTIIHRSGKNLFIESRSIEDHDWQEWGDLFNVLPNDFPLSHASTHADCEDCEEDLPSAKQIEEAKAKLKNPEKMDIDSLILRVHSLRRQYSNIDHQDSPITCHEIGIFIINSELTEEQIEWYVQVMGVASCNNKDKHHLRAIKVSEDLINCLDHHIVENDVPDVDIKKKEPDESIGTTELHQILKDLAEWRSTHSLMLNGGKWVPMYEDASPLNYTEVNGLLFGSGHTVVSEKKIKRWVMAVGISPLPGGIEGWPQCLCKELPGLVKRKPSHGIIQWLMKYMTDCLPDKPRDVGAQICASFDKIDKARRNAGITHPITYLEIGEYLAHKLFTEQEIKHYVAIAGVQPYTGTIWSTRVNAKGKVMLDNDCVISRSLCEFLEQHLGEPLPAGIILAENQRTKMPTVIDPEEGD